MRNLYRRFDWHYIGQIEGGDFAKILWHSHKTSTSKANYIYASIFQIINKLQPTYFFNVISIVKSFQWLSLLRQKPKNTRVFKTCDQSDTNNLDTAPNTVSHTGLFVPKFVMSNSHRQVTHPWQLEKLLPGLLFFCTQMPTFTWRILFTVQTYLFFLEYSKKTCIFFMYIHILGQ